MGGVDAARRVHDGEAFDVVVLAADAIDKLVAAGRIVAGSQTELVRSGVAIAVRRGAPRPGIDTEEALREAVLAARTVGYSTGPSGVALQKLFERWGIAERSRRASCRRRRACRWARCSRAAKSSWASSSSAS